MCIIEQEHGPPLSAISEWLEQDETDAQIHSSFTRALELSGRTLEIIVTKPIEDSVPILAALCPGKRVKPRSYTIKPRSRPTKVRYGRIREGNEERIGVHIGESIYAWWISETYWKELKRTGAVEIRST